MVTQMQRLGLFDEKERDFAGQTYAGLTREITGCECGVPAIECAARFLNLSVHSIALQKLEWLGLFNDASVSPSKGSLRDVLSGLYAEKLQFSAGERDLVVMCHTFDISYPASGKRETITATMADTGSVEGDTSIARTTGIPLGIAADLVLCGAVKGSGVILPTTEDIYIPALTALEREGVVFREEVIQWD